MVGIRYLQHTVYKTFAISYLVVVTSSWNVEWLRNVNALNRFLFQCAIKFAVENFFHKLSNCTISLINVTGDCILGTSDPVSSAFWYFLTAVVVLVACIVSYLGLYRIVSSNLKQNFI